MSLPRLSTIKLGLPAAAAGALAVLAVVLVTIGPNFAQYLNLAHFRPHAPDLGLLAGAPFAIQIHLASAVTALAIGIILLSGVKGTRLHKTLGWTWVAAMTLTALSSFAIRQINGGHLSFIHALSGWTMVSLPMAIWAIKRGKVRAHARSMTGLFVGGLIVAGLLSFLPGRIMWRIVFR